MGDFNIDYKTRVNKKWLNLIELFDLSQLISQPTRITHTTDTIIDHFYTSNPEHITECYVASLSISNHFPICLTRKINCKITKTTHLTTTYRCFKQFDETKFLLDLENDLSTFSVDSVDMNENFDTWHSLIMNCLNKRAPLKSKRVKHKRLPEWFTPEITQMQKLRNKSKLLKQWRDYQRYRNKTKQLIRSAKRKYFSESVKHSKDSSSLWKHLRYISQNKTASSNALPDELIINDETITNSEKVAAKLNEYFTAIAEILNVQPGGLPPSEIEKKIEILLIPEFPNKHIFIYHQSHMNRLHLSLINLTHQKP